MGLFTFSSAMANVTVFLLASLIPLGLAVETTGTAKWIAEQTLSVVGDMPVWVIRNWPICEKNPCALPAS